jgi:hypothetical protein
MFSAQGVGSKLRADYPQQGVKIACRFTVVAQQLEVRVRQQMRDVVARARQKIIDAERIMPPRQ